jgi:hypothetical protein
VDLPAKRGPGYPVTVELFPAFARPEPSPSFPASVRLAFVGPPKAIALSVAPSPTPVTIPAHGSRAGAIPPFPSLAPSPDWSDLVRIRVRGTADDWIAIEREFGVRRQ